MRKVVPVGTRLFPPHAELVFKGIIFDAYHWQQELFDGSYTTFEGLRRADTVTVIAVVDDKLLITNDEQPNRDAVITEPGGRVDETDESTLVAAQRELREETGYVFENWRLVDVVRPYEKMEYFVYTYLAYGDYSQGEPKHDPGERIACKLTSFEAVKQMIADDSAPRLAMQRCLREANSLEELLATAEFTGKEVDVPHTYVTQV